MRPAFPVKNTVDVSAAPPQLLGLLMAQSMPYRLLLQLTQTLHPIRKKLKALGSPINSLRLTPPGTLSGAPAIHLLQQSLAAVSHKIRHVGPVHAPEQQASVAQCKCLIRDKALHGLYFRFPAAPGQCRLMTDGIGKKT